MPIEVIKIGLALLLQGQHTRKIVWGEHVTLHLAADDLDPIEPSRDVEGVLGRHCLGRTDPLAGLDGGLHSTAHYRLRITPGGMLMREQEKPSPLAFRKWDRVTGAELLKISLLLRRS